MVKRVVFAAVLGILTGGLVAAICLVSGGGGTAIPGAIAVLAVNAGAVGFLAGLIAGPPG